MARQVQARRIRCSEVTGRTPYRNTLSNSTRIHFSRICFQMKIMRVLSRGLFLACSRRSRITPVKRDIILIYTVLFFKSIMKRYTIFYRYAPADLGFPKTQGLEPALVEARWYLRVGTGRVRDYSLLGLPGADEAGRKEPIHQADLNERQK